MSGLSLLTPTVWQSLAHRRCLVQTGWKSSDKTELGRSLKVSTFSVDEAVLGSLGRQHNHNQDFPFGESIFGPCGFFAVPGLSAPSASEALGSSEEQEYSPLHTAKLWFSHL